MNGTNTILIADDEQDVRELFSSIFSRHDYRLLYAADGKSAVETAIDHIPDLVLLDIMMPQLDGFEVCRKLRLDPRTMELPIIMVTALNDRDSRLRGIEAGADDFISKPFDLDELEARVRTIIRLNRYRKLLSERAKFERLFDLSPDGIVIVGDGKKIIQANPAMCRMIGVTHQKHLLGKSISSLIATDQGDSYNILFDTIPAPISQSLVETFFIRHDGTRFPIEMSIGAVFYEGTPAFYLIVRDITDRKIFESNLMESEKKYRELVENIEDIMYVMDGRGNVLFVNGAMERSFGYRKEEIIGKKFSEFLVPEDYPLAQSLFKKQIAGEEVGTFELSFKNKKGQRITLEMRERLIWDESTVIEAHGIGRDITERKRIQEKLRKSEEKLMNLFKTSKDVIFICDKEGRFIDINPAGQSLLGYSRDELLLLNFENICNNQREIDHFNEIVWQKGFVKDFELMLRGKDRKTIDCQITATQTNNSRNADMGFQGIIRDITERKRFVDLTLDGIDDGVFTVDNKWKIRYFNSAAEEIMGFSREEAIGKKYGDIFRSDLDAKDFALEKILESNEEIIQKRVSIINANGIKVPISLSSAVLKDKDGVIKGGVVIFRDLSTIEALKKEIELSYTYEDIISKNHKIREIFSTLPYISESGSNVLIEGKSGTGKELFARAIHNLSLQKNGPFIAVNCSAIPDTLLESELFGYVKGAFTNALTDKPGRFALAEGGTLFLDEIVDLPKSLQVKLLRILEEREYEPLGSVASIKTNARIISSANRNLVEEVKKGAFREDLFYRLNVLKITLPDLKERREDIPLLIDHFLKRFSQRQGKDIFSISEEVMDFLMRYDFPGNVRELENIIEHAFVLCRENIILMKHLPKELTANIEPSEKQITALKNHVMDSERELLMSILARYKGDRGKAALALNIGRTSLWRKMKKYNLL